MIIKNFKNLKNGKLNIKNFKSLEFASLNKHKLLFDKYIQLLIAEFKNANIMDIHKFEKISEYKYIIQGNILDEWLQDLLRVEILSSDIIFVDYNYLFSFGHYIGIYRSIKYGEFGSDISIGNPGISPLWKTYTNIIKESYLLNEKIISILFA